MRNNIVNTEVRITEDYTKYHEEYLKVEEMKDNFKFNRFKKICSGIVIAGITATTLSLLAPLMIMGGKGAIKTFKIKDVLRTKSFKRIQNIIINKTLGGVFKC